jgi:fatty acid desaturase
MKTEPGKTGDFWRSASRATLIVFFAAAALLLAFEHRAHLLGVVPLLMILLVCVGAHFFMHRGHGSDHGGTEGGSRRGGGDGN